MADLRNELLATLQGNNSARAILASALATGKTSDVTVDEINDIERRTIDLYGQAVSEKRISQPRVTVLERNLLMILKAAGGSLPGRDFCRSSRIKSLRDKGLVYVTMRQGSQLPGKGFEQYTVHISDLGSGAAA